MSFGIGCRCGSDLALLWLWHRLQLQLDPQPGNLHMPRAQPFKKNANLGARQNIEHPVTLEFHGRNILSIFLCMWSPFQQAAGLWPPLASGVCASLIVASLSFGVGYLFWQFPVYFADGCSAVSCDFGVRGGDLESFCSTVFSLDQTGISEKQ